MKKIIALFLISFGGSNVYSQTINNIPLKDIDVEYVEIVGTSKPLRELIVQIDFGQKTKLYSGNKQETFLKDDQGKELKFNSMIDALNFMAQNGFEFVNAYTVVPTASSNNNIYYFYVLKRKKE